MCFFEIDPYLCIFVISVFIPSGFVSLQRLWGYYLLRSPLFQALTKPCADGVRLSAIVHCHVCATFTIYVDVCLQVVFMSSWIPLVGLLLAYLRDTLCYFQRHYFYTSGSR